MEIGNGTSMFFLPSAGRSYILSGAVLTVIDVIAAVVFLLKKLNSMPFPAAAAIVAAMFALAGSWRLVLRCNEQVKLFSAMERSPSSEVDEVLRTCANLANQAIFLSPLIVGLLLLALIQVVKA